MHNYSRDLFQCALCRECYFLKIMLRLNTAYRDIFHWTKNKDGDNGGSERHYTSLCGPVMMLRDLSGAPQLRRGG